MRLADALRGAVASIGGSQAGAEGQAEWLER